MRRDRRPPALPDRARDPGHGGGREARRGEGLAGRPGRARQEPRDARAIIQKHIDEINEKFARVEQVKKFEILPADLSQEGGELTPDPEGEAQRRRRQVRAARSRSSTPGRAARVPRSARTPSRGRSPRSRSPRQSAAALRPAASRGRSAARPRTAARAPSTPCWRRSAARAARPRPTTRWGGRSRPPTVCSRMAARRVVEVAAASGLSLVAEGERDAEAASTAGTGELIVAAAEAGRGGCWSPPEAARRPTAAPARSTRSRPRAGSARPSSRSSATSRSRSSGRPRCSRRRRALTRPRWPG